MDECFQKESITKPYQYFFCLVDIIVLEMAYYLAYLTVPLVRKALFGDESLIYFETTFSTALLIPLVWLVILRVRGLYDYPKRTPYLQLISRVLQSTLIGLSIVTLILFSFKQGGLSRLLFFIFGVYSFLILIAVRLTEKWYFFIKHRAGHYSEKMIVIGRPDDVQEIQHIIVNLDSLRDYEVVGYFDTSQAIEETKSNVSNLGKMENLKEEIVKQKVGEVLIVWDSQNSSEINYVLDTCSEVGTQVRIIPVFALKNKANTFSIVSPRAESFGGIPTIILSTVKWKPEQEFIKRIMDIIISILFLIPLSPLFLIIAIAIKWSSPGPVFYRMQAIGKNGRDFCYYKFRSMVTNADDLKASLCSFNEMQGPVFKMKKDPRVTPIGRILRKYSFDELPQFWSVFVGNMSLVGPRPPSRSEYERFEFWQVRKLSVRPGITCLWQVSGRNKINSFDEWVRLDLNYIDTWSIWLDLKILTKTAAVVFKGNGL